MASVNKVIIVGNLGRDPETRAFPNGDQLCNIRVATTDKWKDKTTGEAKEHTEWHSIVFNGRLAEIAAQYLRKGSQVYVEGSLRTRKWQDQNGNDRYSTEIRGDTMQMLGGRQGAGDSGYGGDDYQSAPAQRQQAQAPRPAGQQQPSAPAQSHTASQPPLQAAAPVANKPSSGFDAMDDDIPFADPLQHHAAHLCM